MGLITTWALRWSRASKLFTSTSRSYIHLHRISDVHGRTSVLTERQYDPQLAMLNGGRTSSHPPGRAMTKEERWQEFFLNPSVWWDKRSDEKSPKSPDFEQSSSKEAFWIKSLVKPQLTAVTQTQVQCDDASDSLVDIGARGREYTGPVGLNKTRLCVGHHSIARDPITAVNLTFERGPREESNKYSCCTPHRDMWALCKERRFREALHVLDSMDQCGKKGQSDTYVCLLQWCINMKALAEGKQVHAHLIKNGLKPTIILGNTLVNMYAKCGSVMDARQVFDGMLEQNAISWNLMIAGFVKHGHAMEAFKLFRQMEQQGVKPNKITFVSMLKACTSIGALEQGKQIHAQVIKSGLESDIFVGSTLVDMYSKWGSIKHACQVFKKLPNRDVVSWNALIAGYAKHGHAEEVLKFFGQMEQDGLKPDRITFVNVLKAFAKLGNLEEGKQIHALIIKTGFESDIFVGSTLVDMYSKCRRIEDARKVFDRMPKRNVVSWTAMIAGYAQNGHAQEALHFFWQMQQEGVKPNEFTFVSVLNACACLTALDLGKEIHAHIIKTGFESDVFVGNALIDMYAKCGSIDHAQQVFGKMSKRDVVSWNAMITGFVQHGHDEEALKYFHQMELEGLKPDIITFLTVLNACASLAAVERGREVHAYIIRSGLESNVCVGSTLVDMYAKCGSIAEARRVFDKMPKRDVVCWTSMIAGYAQNGLGKEALQLADQMQREGLKLDDITFIGVLSACSRAGLVDQGRHYFKSMSRDYGLTPTAKHYACMVDLLGRAGHLEEAEELVKRMPCEPSVVVWMALLSACKTHGNLEVAKRAAERVLELDPQCVAAFLLLSNLYASSGRWDDKAKVIKMMMDRGLRKEAGFSEIEVNNQVDTFIAEDTLHSENEGRSCRIEEIVLVDRI